MTNSYRNARSDTQPGDKRPTASQRKRGREWGWGKFEVAHGYGWFDDGYDYIARIDDMHVFSGDRAASRQAAKDGFVFLILTPKQRKLVCDSDQLGYYDPYTMLDTRKNRKIIKGMEEEDKELEKEDL